MSASVFTWDWKEQPPMTEIAAEVNRLAGLGRPAWLTGVGDTGGDCYAVVVSDIKLTPEQALQLYTTPDATVQVEVAVEYPGGNSVDVIDIELSELIGLDEAARAARVVDIAADYVNNICSWGAVETGTTDYPEDA